MFTRLGQNPEDAEKRAAWHITELAEQLQDLCYYGCEEDRGLPRETEKELNRCYRVLKQYVVWFRGDDHSLCYEAPTGRFRKESLK